jgi:hypothetical protein
MSATSSEDQMSEPTVVTPVAEVTAELVADLISRGGYTHPLFHPTGSESGPPLPGQGLLLLMGGLVEQSGALDDAVAMVELRRVRFREMVRAGATVRVTVEPGDSTTTSSGRVLREFRWTALDDHDTVLAEADALMLMDRKGEENG